MVFCTSASAFVLAVPESGPTDPLTVIKRTPPTGRLELPRDFLDEGDWHRAAPSLDAQGNIVLISEDNLIWGPVIDPDTGCYAMLRNAERSAVGQFRGIYADSAVVLPRDLEETRGSGGGRVITVFNTAARISLVPLRRVSGSPCPGMFPSLDSESVEGVAAHGRVKSEMQEECR